ncbi:hypothetical protein [Otoolea muris]|uniref:hypothetical protein n=1 Tax=Otoolea muris TaxID=2941515 RepID=UPI00204204C5|nr:hypothetical protein [Otoolea muris]
MKEYMRSGRLRALLSAAAAALLLSAFFMRPGRAFAAALTDKEGALSMEVSFGYGDTAKAERYVRLRVFLKNDGGEDFSGNLELLTTESSLEAYRYDYPVAVAAGERLETVCDIPLGIRADQIYVRVTDQEGARILQKRVKLGISRNVSECFIGVFSDSPEKLEYLDGVGIYYGSIKTRLLNLNAGLAPEDPLGYDQLDLIVVSDYDLNQLSEAQHNAILRWVEKGGNVLIGGGERYRESMGRFAGEILEKVYGEPSYAEVNLGAEYSKSAPQEAVMRLLCVNAELKNGNVLMQGNFPLLSYVQRRKGRVAAAAFALEDIGLFCGDHPAFLEHFYTMIFGEDRVEQMSMQDYSGFSQLYFSVQGLINTGDTGRLPGVAAYTLVIIVYLAFIGPALYLFLKKRGSHRYYLAGAAGCALVFTGIIYIMGVKTRYRGPFFTYATILDASGGQAQEETYVNIRSPYNKPFTVSIRPEYTIRPVTKSYYYDAASAVSFTGEETYKTNIRFLKDRTDIRIRDTVAFTPRLFMLTQELPGAKAMEIGGMVSYFEGKTGGRIVNRFDCRLEDAALLLFGKAILLGDLEPGEERSLEDCEVLNYPLSYTNALAQKLAGGDAYEKADIYDEGYMRYQERSRLLSFYLDSRMDLGVSEARLIAFCPDISGDGFLTGGDFTTEGLSMVTSTIELNRGEGGLVYRPALQQRPTVISGNYEASYNSMYVGEAKEPAVVEYSLGNDLEIQRLSFETVSPCFVNNPRYPYLSAFEGKMYFYNHDTGHNDLMENRESFTAEELKPYLSPTNTLTVKYVDENQNEYGWERHLPMMYVTGKEK